MADDRIPLLTESIEKTADAEQAPAAGNLSEAEMEFLRSRLTRSGLVLIERLLAHMLKDLESALVDRMRRRARHELPILIDDILKEQLSGDPGETQGKS
ncbi:MAG: hypothetical protein V3R53_06400 [Gammaproteobacteria bacterium]